MKCWWTCVAVTLVIICSRCSAASSVDQANVWKGLDEFCQWEAFRAECKADEVVIVKRAIYGRMQYGRCIKRDYGYVGCFADVLQLADSRCSGRQSCEISIPDKLFDGTAPCPEDLKLYLMAEYVCIKVATPISGRCHSTALSTSHSTVAGGRHDSALAPVLSSRLTTETGCGSPQTPWIVDVEPGQRINLTLIDFTVTSSTTNNASSSGHCHVYAIVKETQFGRTETICGNASPLSVPSHSPATSSTVAALSAEERREKHVYMSTGHVLEIRFMTSGKTGHYLLKYSAVGCTDLVPPINGWWKRHDAVSASSGCGSPDSRDSVWQWTCRHSKWIGDGALPLVNCTNSHPAPETYSGAKQLSALSHVVALVIIVSLAVAIGLMMLIVGLCVIKRHRASLIARGAAMTSEHSSNTGIGNQRPGIQLGLSGQPAYAGGYMLPGGPPRPGQLQNQHQAYSQNKEHPASYCSGSDGNDYAYVEDLLCAASAFGPNYVGQGPPGTGHLVTTSGTASGTVRQLSSFSSSSAWCAPPTSTGRPVNDAGSTYATGGGRFVQHML